MKGISELKIRTIPEKTWAETRVKTAVETLKSVNPVKPVKPVKTVKTVNKLASNPQPITINRIN